MCIRDSKYTLETFHGGGMSRDLICKHKTKICIPTTLQKRTVSWYHENLCHPGINRTEDTIRQHLHWKSLRNDVTTYIYKCDICQLNKKTNKRKYGHLPPKEAETEPWETLCVDLIGPYTLERKGKKKPLKLQALTMIDPATRWFEIVEYDDKKSITISNLVEKYWLSRYP